MLSPTQLTYFNQTQATDSPTEIDFSSNHMEKLTIDVTYGGAIRVQVNNIPAVFDANNGILVTYEKPLVLYEHNIFSIQFIRDAGEGSNVPIQILGLY